MSKLGIDPKLLHEFRGELCPCGKPKTSGNSFCHACFRALPRAMQIALYKRFGDGYEASYADALAFLRRPA